MTYDTSSLTFMYLTRKTHPKGFTKLLDSDLNALVLDLREDLHEVWGVCPVCSKSSTPDRKSDSLE